MHFGTQLIMINLYQCAKGFKTAERFLGNQYFLYVHNGKGKFKIDRTTYEAKMGDLFFCETGIGNTIIADEDYPFLLSGIDFHVKGYGEFLRDIPERMNILSDPFSVGLIFHMINEFKTGKIYSNDICDAALKTFVLETLKNARLGFSTEENTKLKMLAFIEENFNKSLTYKELSQITAYHKNSINRILKSITGMSLREYIVSLRIKKAIELLIYSSNSIARIAELCGYNSPIFFSRQFKEKMGKKPTEFRKSNRIA